MRPHAEQHLEHRSMNGRGIFRLEVFITQLKQGRLFQQGEADKPFYRPIGQAFIFNRLILIVNEPGVIALPEFQVDKDIKPLSSDPVGITGCRVNYDLAVIVEIFALQCQVG